MYQILFVSNTDISRYYKMYKYISKAKQIADSLLTNYDNHHAVIILKDNQIVTMKIKGKEWVS